MSIPGSAFRSTNHAQTLSNVHTTQQQGGGDKKAGFPYQIGRESWSSVTLGTCNPQTFTDTRGCCSLRQLQYTVNPRVSISRPIGSTYSPNVYFRVPL
jgi:hypothetical protein